MSARDFEPGAPHRVGWARPRPLTPTPNSERRAPAQPSKPTTAQLCRLPSSIAAGLVHRAEPPMPWPPRAALLRTRPQGKERVYVPLLYLVPAWMLAGIERVVEPHWRFPTASISFRTACIWQARKRLPYARTATLVVSIARRWVWLWSTVMRSSERTTALAAFREQSPMEYLGVHGAVSRNRPTRLAR